MVYLLRRNIKTTRPSDKLDFKKLRLFPVKKVISITNYELTLPKIIRIYLIFYISLLEEVLQDEEELQDYIEVLDENKYEVEEILDIRTKDKKQ